MSNKGTFIRYSNYLIYKVKILSKTVFSLKGLTITVIGFIILMSIYMVVKSVRIDANYYVQVGTFIAIVLTLIALILYAYDTHSIASVTKSRWERENVLSTSYSLGLAAPSKGTDRVFFRLMNPSTLVIRAKVQCNFMVYGERVDYHDDFNSKKTWYIFPQQESLGFFELSQLLAKKGKTLNDMKNEMATANKYEQLTMDLEIKLWDELGTKRRLPSRRHFFDFQEWRWVPTLTKEDDWDWDDW